MEKKVTILCIDDEKQICLALQTLFETQKWETLMANNVEDGLRLFSEMHPDLVLIDYHMPGMNGVEGVRHLRRRSASVPIIVFTIEEDQTVADAFLEAGASDFALKPIKAPDIVSRIRLHLQMLEQNRLNAESAFRTKGISEGTLKLITDYFSQRNEQLTADDVAKGTGLAYQTVFRYLQYMTQENLLEVESVYGKVGRPKQMYRLAT